MEVKPGYMLTEVGVIPEDWEVKPFGELASSIGYGSSAKSDQVGLVPVLRMGNLQDGKIDWNNLVYTSDSYEIDKYLLSKKDILFNRTNTIDLVGKASIYTSDRTAIFAGYLIRVKVNQKQYSAEYLNYILNTSIARKYSLKVLSLAVGQANINGEKLKTYPIPIPPTLFEQARIVDALSDVDALINSLNQLITKKRDIKQAAMQELLTGNRRRPGFKRNWENHQLGELAEIVNGGTPKTGKPEYWNGNINWCTPTDITSCTEKYLYTTERKISAEGLANCSAQILPKGTLLLCSRATIGEIRIAGCEVCTNQGFKSLICKPNVNNEYLFYKLLTMKSKMLEKCIGSTFLELSKKDAECLELEVPLIDEQIAITEKLSDMDSEIAALEKRRDKTKLLKQAMMQELLTGRIRLI